MHEVIFYCCCITFTENCPCASGCCFVLNRKVVDSPKHLSYFTQNIPCNFTRTLWVFKV